MFSKNFAEALCTCPGPAPWSCGKQSGRVRACSAFSTCEKESRRTCPRIGAPSCKGPPRVLRALSVLLNIVTNRQRCSFSEMLRYTRVRCDARADVMARRFHPCSMRRQLREDHGSRRRRKSIVNLPDCANAAERLALADQGVRRHALEASRVFWWVALRIVTLGRATHAASINVQKKRGGCRRRTRIVWWPGLGESNWWQKMTPCVLSPPARNK